MTSAMDVKWMNKSPKKFEYFLQQQRLNPPGEPTGKGKQPLNYKFISKTNNVLYGKEAHGFY